MRKKAAIACALAAGLAISAGVCVTGFASRDDNGAWFGNFSEWHLKDKDAKPDADAENGAIQLEANKEYTVKTYRENEESGYFAEFNYTATEDGELTICVLNKTDYATITIEDKLTFETAEFEAPAKIQLDEGDKVVILVSSLNEDGFDKQESATVGLFTIFEPTGE